MWHTVSRLRAELYEALAGRAEAQQQVAAKEARVASLNQDGFISRIHRKKKKKTTWVVQEVVFWLFLLFFFESGFVLVNKRTSNWLSTHIAGVGVASVAQWPGELPLHSSRGGSQLFLGGKFANYISLVFVKHEFRGSIDHVEQLEPFPGRETSSGTGQRGCSAPLEVAGGLNVMFPLLIWF